MNTDTPGKRIIRSRTITFLMMILLLLWTKALMAVPANPAPADVKQPDGTMVTVYLKGDEHAHWNESDDGFLITKNAKNNQWVYMVNQAGKIVPGSHAVGKADAKTIGAVKPDKALISAQAASNRAEQLSQAQPPALVPSTGTLKNLVVLVNFSDLPITYSNQDYDNLFNQVGYTSDGATGSVKDYYHEVSYNALTVQSTIAGPVTLDNGYAYYGANSGGYDINPGQMVRDALVKLEASGFDFTTVDGDGDGWVDDLTIIHAGGGEEYSGNNPSYIWSHYSGISTVTYDGVSMSMYHTEPSRRGWDDYPSSQGITRIGVICHESGHFLGLPDLYDYGYDSEGVGNFCLMSGGSWNGNSGTTPAQMSAWCKCDLGWIIPTLKSSSETYSLPQVETNPVVTKLQGPTFPSTEYFLVENRQGVGFDAGIPGPSRGILIWHVDESKYNNNDQTHYKVDLEEASCTQHLELNQSVGDDADYYRSGNATVFSDTSCPSNLSYSGQPLGINITNVGTTGANMSVTLASNTSLSVSSITPAGGVTGTSVNITNLAGFNFESGATVQLVKSGQSDITATNVIVVNSTKITCSFSLPGAFIGFWDVKVTNPDLQSATLSNGFNVTAEASTSFEDFETGDFSKLPWSTSGNANWTITSQDKYSGAFSARAGAITDSQSTTLQVTVNCIAGNITFYRKVSSESNYDYLKFYIDGVQQGSWSGTVNWSQVSYPVSAGSRTFRWTYSKDSSLSIGSDTAWIDDISFPMDTNSITIGTGTSTWDYPMYTYYHDSRTQVIYLASEIHKAGNITSLALDVATVPGQIMNYWTIRMKHTSLSSYNTASFESTGWTTVYQGTEPIGSTGWRTFTFNTPFAYNGTDNLMVDFSHNNSSYSTSGYCRYSIPGGIRTAYAYTDSGYGDPLNWTGTTSPQVYSSTYIPNVRLSMSSGGQPGPFKISGYIKTSTQQTIPGVLVSANTGEANTTDANGYYEIPFVASPWSGTITPVKAEWSFTPINKSYTNISSNQTNQNFTGKYSYGGGTGTSNDPYLIYTAAQMNSIGKDANDWNKYFKLMADIDISAYTGQTFNMIGFYDWSPSSKGFSGVFDGNGHSISGFTYHYSGTNQSYIGMFGYLNGTNAEIKNLTIINPDVNSGQNGVNAGALVGEIELGTVRNCAVKGGIIRGIFWGAGGLVGDTFGQIIDCNSDTEVQGGQAGGIVGYIWGGGLVQNCKSYSHVFGEQTVGGIAGENAGTITGCFATGTINGESYIGGITGENTGNISQCFASCDVNASQYDAGGFAGRNIYGMITNCYSNGTVYANNGVGGFVSVNWDANIIHCYSSTYVEAPFNTGGFIQYDMNGTTTGSFWDIQASGKSISAGGTGKTTAQMKTSSTFTDAGWDFDTIWTIDQTNDYPRFIWQPLRNKCLYVDPNGTGTRDGSSWENGFHYLQDALSAARKTIDVNEIRVATATYFPDRNEINPQGAGDRFASFKLIDGVILTGGYAGYSYPTPDTRDMDNFQTILSGDLLNNDNSVDDALDLNNNPTRSDNSYNVITSRGNSSSTVIDGFLITGGNANGPTTNWFLMTGGGMFVDGGNIRIKNCNFNYNIAGAAGAGLCLVYNDSNIFDCRFFGNFLNDSETLNDGGAALAILACDNPAVSINNCVFNQNKSYKAGGAISNYFSNININDSVFTQNYTLDNSPDFSDAQGGAIVSFIGRLNLWNCLFADNHAIGEPIFTRAGAIYNDYKTQPDIRNCTFVNNTSSGLGGGIFNSNEANMISVTNCILWNNSDKNGTGQSSQFYGNYTFSINHSCIEGLDGSLGGIGNIGPNPLFVTGPLGDFYLSQTAAGQASQSPCVNTGSASAASLGLDVFTTRTDETGDEGTVDMGYHYPVSSSSSDENIIFGLNLDHVWMYQNLSGQTKSNITAEINDEYFSDPQENGSYTIYWEMELPGDVTVMPTMISGGENYDVSCTIAAPSCSETAGLSDSGQTFKVRVRIVGDDFGNFGVAEKEFAIALLGDINNDGIVNVTDRSIANTFWRTGAAGTFTFKDCDLNCDNVVNVTDRSITNSIWRGALGSNSVSVPCPLR